MRKNYAFLNILMANYLLISLDDMEVFATLIRMSLGNSLTFLAKCSSIYLQASLTASLKPLITLVGCTLFLISSLPR